MSLPGRPVRNWGLGLLLALLLIVTWEISGRDIALTRLFGDAGGFAWRDAWLTSKILHDGGRALAGVLLAVLLWDLIHPIWTGPTRLQRGYWLAVVIASWILVPAFKRVSKTSCPWELAEFGGRASYVPHWMPGVADGGTGHCFPSGHATTAFAFVALYFLWREYRPGAARHILLATLLGGAVLAWAQLARGAHHLSHSLWSAWFCAAGAFVASFFAPRGRLFSAAPLNA